MSSLQTLLMLEQAHEASFFLTHPFVITILAIIFLALALKWSWSLPTNKKKLPPSPPKLPIIGNLHSIGLYPHRTLHAWSQRLGSLMLLYLGSRPVLVVSSADAATEILKNHDIIFASRPKTRAFQKFFYNQKDVAMAPYGEYWRQTRSICVQYLLSNKMVQSFHAIREDETSLMMERIKRATYSSLPVNLSEQFVMLTNNIICRVALGRKFNEGKDGRKFGKLLREFTDMLGDFNIGDYIPWLAWVNKVNGWDAKANKLAKEFDDFLEEVVEEHMQRQKKERYHDGNGNLQGEEQKDFVDVLLWVQRENVVGFPVERVSIKAIILDMFAAGTDTTSSLLEWAMTELLKHPQLMKELRKEVRGIAGDKSYVTEDDLDKMHYLKAVIKETLRFHPPVPLLVPRQSTKDVNIQGYDIEAGTQVIVNAWAISKDPKTWEKPEEFIPERFVNTSIDFRGQDFELIPFGSGRRGCPGATFAIKVNELLLANLVHKFDWALPDGAEDNKTLDTTEISGITVQKKYPLIVIANPCC